MAKTQIERPFKMVEPVFEKGVGRFSFLLCPEGHTLRQVPYGEWGDAKKIKELKCYSCGKNKANELE